MAALDQEKADSMFRGSVILLLLSAVAWAAPGSHSVALTWADGDGTVVSYNVYRGTATGVCSGSPTPFAKGIVLKSYTDSSVTAGTTYFYAVSALNSAGGESACSAEAQATVPSSPAPPTNLQGTAN